MYSKMTLMTVTIVRSRLPRAIDPKLLIDLQTLLIIGAVGSPD